ncbi:MAG: hypothetical protein K9G46_09100 [Flavobacteriales bacterium]|nr:hypothetical protein [Flavobacteriales bacterium]
MKPATRISSAPTTFFLFPFSLFSFTARLILFSFFLFSFHSCTKYPVFKGDYTRIETAPGPEDIALDTNGGMERIIASCSERRTMDYSHNGFYSFDIQSQKLAQLVVTGLPTSIQLRPHGIDIGMVNGVKTLYVVNHEQNAEDFPPAGRQSILVFELKAEEVVFVQQLTHPLIVSPNDVCTDTAGGIFVSIDSGKINSKWEKLMALKKSYVLHFNGEVWQMVGQKLRYANGVGVANGRIYITGTQEKNIFSYKINADGTFSDRQEYSTMKGNDNITFSNGKLVTTAHLDFIKFLKHVKDAEALTPCIVYSMDLETHQLDTLYLDNGTVMSAASTGLIYNDVLYASQIFNSYIIAIPLVD